MSRPPESEGVVGFSHRGDAAEAAAEEHGSITQFVRAALRWWTRDEFWKEADEDWEGQR